MRVMAIDYGDARTGIAVSDLLASLCGDAFTIAEWDPVRLSQRIAQEVRSRGVERLVLGLPRNMDGSEGPRAEKTRAFQKLLEAETGLEVQLWDERRTSVDAHQILHAVGKKAKQHRKQVDAVAASLILEAYLGTLP
jgi:putative Holliday junction resolvase